VAASYDALAGAYEENWLQHLRPVTDRLLARVPLPKSGVVFDLGCGTGYTTEWLARQAPALRIQAQDLSRGMLNVAAEHVRSERVTFACNDMLDFLKGQADGTAALVLSAWAIGYSKPWNILKETFRTLEPGGHFALVVNLLDTLRPIYFAFRKTMQRFPEKLRALSWPRFPASRQAFERQAAARGFELVWSEDGRMEVGATSTASLSWLLNTGILAGFDAMLPLRSDSEAAAWFEQCLRSRAEPLEHHYLLAVLRKHE
jgi:trans-aconitate methyltransferase